MQALADNNGLAIIWNPENNRGSDWTGTNYPIIRRELGKPKQVTLRKLKAQGWICNGELSGIFWWLSESGWEELGKLPEGYLVPELQHMDAREIVEILKRRYSSDRGWMFFTELTISTHQTRRLDGFAFRIDTMNKEPADAPFLERVAFEIKVDRGDWKNELDDPNKRIPAMEISHKFYFVAPAGVIPDHQIPDECGLLEVTAEKRLVTTIESPYHPSVQPDWGLVAGMLRCLEKAH
jgi:hypothetical protein